MHYIHLSELQTTKSFGNRRTNESCLCDGLEQTCKKIPREQLTWGFCIMLKWFPGTVSTVRHSAGISSSQPRASRGPARRTSHSTIGFLQSKSPNRRFSPEAPIKPPSAQISVAAICCPAGRGVGWYRSTARMVCIKQSMARRLTDPWLRTRSSISSGIASKRRRQGESMRISESTLSPTPESCLAASNAYIPPADQPPSR